MVDHMMRDTQQPAGAFATYIRHVAKRRPKYRPPDDQARLTGDAHQQLTAALDLDQELYAARKQQIQRNSAIMLPGDQGIVVELDYLCRIGQGDDPYQGLPYRPN